MNLYDAVARSKEAAPPENVICFVCRRSGCPHIRQQITFLQQKHAAVMRHPTTRGHR